MDDVARISAVEATGPARLAVTWVDGTASTVDLAGWIARGGRRFAALGNALVFAQAKAGLYDASVTWDDEEGDLSIDAEHLRMLAEHQAPFDAAAAAAWQAELRVSNAEAADLVGVATSTWAGYKAGAAIPDTVARLCRMMRDDPAALAAHLRPRTAGNPGGGPVYVRDAIHLDMAEEAELRVSGRPPERRLYLHDAVISFYALPDEQQARAVIETLRDGKVYKASAIRRFHDAPDGEGAVRGALQG